VTTTHAPAQTLPIIDAAGSRYPIGAAIGETLAEGLRGVAEGHQRGLERTLGWARALEITRQLVPHAEAALPGCVAELRGMAAGSGLPFETLFSLNALQEIRFLAGRDGARPDSDDEDDDEGCTSLAVTGAATANGHVLLAHNEDAGTIRSALPYVVRARPDDGPAFVGFAYSGLLLYQGLNAAGVGSVGNALYATDIRPGTPKLLAYRDVLEAGFLEDAIRRTHKPTRANGNNHLLANAAGELYDVEVSGGAAAVLPLPPEREFLTHANHFTDPAMQTLEWGDLLNSRMRQTRVERPLARQVGNITVESLFEILSDHSNYPKSVCKHPDPVHNPDVQTVASVVVDLTAGELHVRPGHPCTAPTTTVALAG
jgi:isopenicillin-N N-acyltransferase-like protein